MSDKYHDLTLKYLDANYDLSNKSIEDYILEYESTYIKIKDLYKNLKRDNIKVLK